MIRVLDLTVERIITKNIKDEKTGKESQLAKVLYVKDDGDFYIGYLSMYDVNKMQIGRGLKVQGIFDNGKIKLLG